jgi:adenosylcobinamide-GDP ribazoletransferase
MRRFLRALRLAFAFLTIVPVRVREGEATEAELAASRFAYPVVGIAIGLFLAALSELLDWLHAPGSIAAFLLVAAGAVISGGLHLDGLADSADGLFLWESAERRLAVMRDPHAGSFGVAAIVLVLLGKFAALDHLASSARGMAILSASTISRSLILVSAGSARYARPEGTGRVLVEATRRRDAIGAALVAIALGGVFSRGPGLLAGIAALALAWTITRYAARRLGGITGDVLGALIELGELTVLVILGLIDASWAK